MEILKSSNNGQTIEYLKLDGTYENILQIDTDDLFVLVNKIFTQEDTLPTIEELNIEQMHNVAAKVVADQVHSKLQDFQNEVDEFKESLKEIYNGPLKGVDYYLNNLE